MAEQSADEARALIEALGLTPHPEGGWYRELHRSAVAVRRDGDGSRRCGLTLITYLLEAGAISRWHRVRGADEIWQHLGGAPLQLWRLPPGGGRSEALTLAPLQPQQPELTPCLVVAADWWQAARSLGAWSLVSCCVGPGFDFADFELLREQTGGAALPGADPALL
ncbi:MAG: cupin domain-containing protein [Synechococcaceae cyanobacterium]|nr:cupin domain-containing protein [Synechococcaceae cyanobacterium]